MKLYTTGKGHWAGTQADARKLKKEHSVPCELYEVPVSKQELLEFLNGNTVKTDASPSPVESTAVPEHVEEDTKIVGETREEYMRRWKQEQADWDAEYKCKAAIEEVLWNAPLDHVGGFIHIILSRVEDVVKEKEDE